MSNHNFAGCFSAVVFKQPPKVTEMQFSLITPRGLSNQSQLCRITGGKSIKRKSLTIVWAKKSGSKSGNQNPRTHLVNVSSIVQQ